MKGTAEKLWDRGLAARVFASTFLVGLAAHGYCYFNLLYSHDSLLVNQENDIGQMIGVGRVMVPLYLKFRGMFYPPLLVGALSLLFLAGASYLAVRLLGLKNGRLVCLTCGVFASSATLTLINATYIKDADVYMLALLLAVAAAYLCDRYRVLGFFGAAALVCASLGLYQAMFQAGVFLAMILVVRRILERREFKEVLLSGLKQAGAFLLGLLAYAAVLRLVLGLRQQGLTDSYNGLGGVGQFGSLREMLVLAVKVCCYPAGYLFSIPETYHSGWMAVLNLLLGALTLAMLAYLAAVRGVRGLRLALLAAVVALMPFGMSVVFFISKGMVHLLMIFSFYFVYLFGVMVLELFLEDAAAWEGWKGRLRRVLPGAVSCALGVLILNSVVYANQAYLKKDLEYQATLSTVTRIVDRIEQLEGYVPGETPVALLGDLEHSGLFLPREGMAHLDGTGLAIRVGLTYSTTYYWYFRHILSYPILLLDGGAAEELGRLDEVADMPAFPAPGSCRMADGVAVVKLS